MIDTPSDIITDFDQFFNIDELSAGLYSKDPLPPLDVSAFEYPIGAKQPADDSNSFFMAGAVSPVATVITPGLSAGSPEADAHAARATSEASEWHDDDDVSATAFVSPHALTAPIPGDALPLFPAARSAGSPTPSASQLDHIKEEDDDGGSTKRRRNNKVARASVAQFATPDLHFTSSKSNLPPVPDWTDKPDAETYKSLNSKEKRQLRNKISARNFRHRRKEYITTLEGEIATRDELISGLQDEVQTMKEENQELRTEVHLLKRKWEEMMAKMTEVASKPDKTNTHSLGLSKKTPRYILEDAKEDRPRLDKKFSFSLLPEVNKDAWPAPLNNHASDHAASVHNLFVPDMQANLNPALNALSEEERKSLPAYTAYLRGNWTGLSASVDNASSPEGASPSSTLSGSSVETPGAPVAEADTSFLSSHALSLHPGQIEAYRSDLYGKVAHNMAGLQAAERLVDDADASSEYLPLPAGFKPAFFSDSTSSSELEATKYVAGKATQTLMSRLLASVIRAFADEDMLDSSFHSTLLNPNKVARVLSGDAKLVVAPTSRRDDPLMAHLGQQLDSLSLSPMVECK